MKIIDCFTFYNELDLLNYRLNILKDVVDYVVIVESTHTFIGNEKRLYFDELKSQNPQYNDTRIIHVIVDDFPYKAPNIQLYCGGQQWDNEYFQRNCILRGIQQIPNLSDEDAIIVSDLDEIPDPRTLQKIKNGELIITLNSLEMKMYYYNLNTTMVRYWSLGFITKYGILKKISMKLNCIRSNTSNLPTIHNGGWHMSYFGDIKHIQNKLKEFSHVEYSGDEYTNEEFIKYKVNRSESLFDTDSLSRQSIKDDDYLPVDYEKYLSMYVACWD